MNDYIPTTAYTHQDIAGWTVRVCPEQAQHRREFSDGLDVLRGKLVEIARLVPPDRVAFLRGIPFWVEWLAKPNGAAEFHPSAQWLRENGYNPEKVGGIEINNIRNFVAWQAQDQPMMVLHELSHAYHFKVLGEDYLPIRAAFENARQKNLYESVEYVRGGKKRAYALTNEKEFFAELSEAYFGRNDFYPFTRDALRTYDPVGYLMVEKAWTRPPGKEQKR